MVVRVFLDVDKPILLKGYLLILPKNCVAKTDRGVDYYICGEYAVEIKGNNVTVRSRQRRL